MFLARGATVFWALWGYQHDRDRLGRNLATLREWGIDYIRVLGVVGAPGNRPGDSWSDRRADPTSATYDEDIAALTDWAYREYGLRVQWTIFGGVDFTPTAESRRSLVDRFANMSRGREEKVFAFEIANEGWQNGFEGEAGRLELRALAHALKAKTHNLVALTAPHASSCAAAQALYRGSAADLVTLHLPRAGMEGGAFWDTFREPWAFRGCSDVPALTSSNEPIGPEASIASVDDPAALAALAGVTYGAGIGAFVFHTGPGVRGGGAADVARSRHGNFRELPTGARIAAALGALVQSLPGDFSNWQKQDALAATGPGIFDVTDRTALNGMYCFSKTPLYTCIAFGIRRPLQLLIKPGRRISIAGAAPTRIISGNFQ